MEQSNNWEKLKVISTTASIVIIPLVIAFLGNLYSKSIKEKEIQGRFVELSLQILKDKPSEENKNIRKWAVDVINEYSGVKLEPDAKKDLIEKVPLTMNNNTGLQFNVPISNNNSPVQVGVVFGNANIGTVLISIYDSNNGLIAKYQSSDTLYTLPKLDFEKTDYFTVVITGTSINTNSATNEGTAQVTFYQDNKSIASKGIRYKFIEEGGIHTFIAKGKVFLNK